MSRRNQSINNDLDEWFCIFQVFGVGVLLLLAVNFMVNAPIAIGIIIVAVAIKDYLFE